MRSSWMPRFAFVSRHGNAPLPDAAADRRSRPILIASTVLMIMLLAVPFGILATIDHGLLDGLIARQLSTSLGRPLSFSRVRTHLLSRRPQIELWNMRIAGRPGYGHDDLARVRHLDAELSPAALLTGSVAFRSLDLDGLVLQLVRLGPDRNNWSTPNRRKGGLAFAPLASVERLRIDHGSLRFRDFARRLDVAGPFRVDDAANAFYLQAQGLYGGAPVAMAMTGGRLNGSAVGPPYPFAAHLVDGHTEVAVRGTSIQPFDFSGYALAVRARGPNLADLGYLFNLVTPNTPPFKLISSAHASHGYLRFDHLEVVTGSSRVTGAIWADHNNPRRDLLARLRAPRLDRAEINALLAPVPPRAIARDKSGAVLWAARSKFVISDAPLGLARLRATDLDFQIAVDALTGYALPLRQITTRLDLDHGLLDVPRFRASLFGGTVRGRLRIDAQSAVPKVAIAARLVGLQLAQLSPGAAGSSGQVDSVVRLEGAGISLHDAAANATGNTVVHITNATVPQRAAWLLGGDLLRAAMTGNGGGSSTLTGSAAAGSFQGSGGHLLTTNLEVSTSRGTASGSASIDLGTEHFCVVLMGHPDRARLFQVAAPARIEGPWLHPALSVLPGRKANALGLRGKLGVLFTPVAGLLPIRGLASASCG